MDNWLINFLVLVLLVVVLDGARRAFIKHRASMKVSRKLSRSLRSKVDDTVNDILSAARKSGSKNPDSTNESAIRSKVEPRIEPDFDSGAIVNSRHESRTESGSASSAASSRLKAAAAELEFIDPEEAAKRRQIAAELPGSVRVVQRRAPEDASQVNRQVQENFYSSRKPLAGSNPARKAAEQTTNRTPEQASLNLEEQVPTLMDSVAEERREPTLDESSSFDSLNEVPPEQETSTEIAESRADTPYDTYVERAEPKAESSVHVKPSAEKPEPQKKSKWDLRRKPEPPAPQKERQVEEVLILNILAPQGDYFEGNDLLRVLLSSGMRFGEMNIFHYHSGEAGEGPVIFSLANLVMPGTFDLTQMEDFTSPGISLFLALPVATGEALKALDILLATARGFADQLGGELKDENRSVFTGQTAEHYRQRVMEFQRRKALAKAQA